ncbi:MAG: hypothetical protein M3Q69_19310 [Acidobacteriota bacterium]|nr:hypothetical protein [Acidobacteriota bacterium]
MPKRLPKSAVVGAVWAWILVLMLTHLGAKSPYSYGWAIFGQEGSRLLGMVVNPDSRIVYNFTFFLYEAGPLDWNQAQNLKLPLHTFSVAMLVGITGSYLLASLIVNFLYAALVALAAVTLADRYALRRSATLVALLTLYSLPLYVEYLGQPLQYIVGPAVSFLVIMSVFALEIATRAIPGLPAWPPPSSPSTMTRSFSWAPSSRGSSSCIALHARAIP